MEFYKRHRAFLEEKSPELQTDRECRKQGGVAPKRGRRNSKYRSRRRGEGKRTKTGKNN